MDFCRFHSSCLGIPTPESLQELISTPPVCLSSRGDQEATEIIEKTGQYFGRPEDEITQAKALASGFSDLVIVLERPLDRRDHKFNTSFDNFTKSSPTLSAVDELIRFATKGARSIHTVTVLNAFSYHPDKSATEGDKECHECLARILRAKKPKVILRCHREEYWDEWLKRIELPGKDYQLERKEINITEEHTAVVLQSFHPSCAVNNADCRPEYRALLIYHFVAAFSELRSEFSLPETAEEIRKLCLIKGERRKHDTPDYEPWQAASLISQALEQAYRGPCKARFVRFSDETPFEHRRNQIEAFNAMFGSLRQLLGNSKTFGALGIAKVVLFLWKHHFQDDPLYEHIMFWLLLRGNKQADWFARETNRTSNQRNIEEQVSNLRIAEPSIIRDIRELNKDATLLASRVAITVARAENVEESLRIQAIDVFGKHNALIRGHLQDTSPSNINYALRVRNLLICCEVFLSAINDKNAGLERGDCRGLISSLGKLAKLIDNP